MIVGRTPRSAADALVGLSRNPIGLIWLCKSGSGGTRADQGVRPTICEAYQAVGNYVALAMLGCPTWRSGVVYFPGVLPFW